MQHEQIMSAAVAEARQVAASNAAALTALTNQLQQLTPILAQITTPASASPAPAPVLLPSTDAPEPRVGTPERYDGDPETCGPFLTNCSLLFSLQPRTFASEQAKVAFMINHLTGRARLWGTAEWDRQSPACSSFQSFSQELRKVFGMGSSSSRTTQGLIGLQQGDRTVADYSIDFRTRASLSSWNSAAQVDAFLHSLAEYIKDELVSHEVPSTLDGIIELAIRIDLRIQVRRRERRQGAFHRQASAQFRGPPTSSSSFPSQQMVEPEPMQLGRTALTPEEREHRRGSNLCMYCGKGGHFVSTCPVKAKTHP